MQVSKTLVCLDGANTSAHYSTNALQSPAALQINAAFDT